MIVLEINVEDQVDQNVIYHCNSNQFRINDVPIPHETSCTLSWHLFLTGNVTV